MGQYQMQPSVVIRACEVVDIPEMLQSFMAIGWDKPPALFEQYLAEQQAGVRNIWIARAQNQFAGYVTLAWQSQYTYFTEQGIPEIMDLNVLPTFRKQGIGAQLLAVAETKAATKSATVGLGVGLYGGIDGGYGPAQRLYIKHGYLPDGKGVTYAYQPAVPGAQVRLDDDLVLWMTKSCKA